MHAPNLSTTTGIIESFKEPLEARIWYNYSGQSSPITTLGLLNRPSRIGRVHDDGSTQLYTYGYDGFGHVTNSVDPLGRERSFSYSTNGIDLLEVRQTQGTNNELILRTTYTGQHRPQTVTDAAGQTTTFTYNSRGQPLTVTNPKGETRTYTYDSNGYLVGVDGALPGTSDGLTVTHDAFGRSRTRADESGYTLTFDYDNMDRLTRITHPDATFSQFTYNRLDLAAVRDRAGRQTSFEYDVLRQMTKRTDPLGRIIHFQWCSCGSLGSFTDPMGRTTQWHSDVQGRPLSKEYADGSKVSYFYENTTSRVRQVIDEKSQVAQFTYNRDNTVNSIAYPDATIPTPGVSYVYDPNYERVVSMIDGIGTTLYSYLPIGASPGPGAGKLASVDGPLPEDTITYGYDELGRRVTTAISGVPASVTYDQAGRAVAEANALGSFTYGYEGTSGRLMSQSFPNGQTTELSYYSNLEDQALQRITHKVGQTKLSEFLYSHDVATGQINTWSQQAGALPANLHTLGYDGAGQLLSATVTANGTVVDSFAYSYDQSANRLSEQLGSSSFTSTYNALNQLSTSTAPGAARTNEWDALDRLVAVSTGAERTEFTYDGLSRLATLRLLTNGSQVSFRRFVWCGEKICEERDVAGVVTKRFFDQGVKLETGPAAGTYFYTRDHLGSIREVTDASGTLRARYSYGPYGRRTRVSGDVEADFAFAGMLWSSGAGLSLTHYRAYDPGLGRWLSRDPLENAEMTEGPNLYAYALNDPVNRVDILGLMSTMKTCMTPINQAACVAAGLFAGRTGQTVGPRARQVVASIPQACKTGFEVARQGADRVANIFVTRGGSNLHVSGRHAATLITSGAADRLDRLRLALDWWRATIQATETYRQTLTADEAQAFMRYLIDTSHLLFGY